MVTIRKVTGGVKHQRRGARITSRPLESPRVFGDLEKKLDARGTCPRLWTDSTAQPSATTLIPSGGIRFVRLLAASSDRSEASPADGSGKPGASTDRNCGPFFPDCDETKICEGTNCPLPAFSYSDTLADCEPMKVRSTKSHSRTLFATLY